MSSNRQSSNRHHKHNKHNKHNKQPQRKKDELIGAVNLGRNLVSARYEWLKILKTIFQELNHETMQTNTLKEKVSLFRIKVDDAQLAHRWNAKMEKGTQSRIDALIEAKRKIDADLERLNTEVLGYKNEKEKEWTFWGNARRALNGYEEALESQKKKMVKVLKKYESKLGDLGGNIKGVASVKDIIYSHGKDDEYIDNALNSNQMMLKGGGRIGFR